MDLSQLSARFSGMRVALALNPPGAPRSLDSLNPLGPLGLLGPLGPPLLHYVDNDPPGVFSGRDIARGTILGEIAGTPRDIYDIRHTEYMMLTDSCMLDLRADPEQSCEAERSILTWITEDNCTFAEVNCRILRDVSQDRFYMQAIADIPSNTQLVYSMQRYDEVTRLY